MLEHISSRVLWQHYGNTKSDSLSYSDNEDNSYMRSNDH